MANDSDGLAWIIIVFAVCGGVVVGIWGTNWVPFTSEVTVYRVMCSGEIKNGSCEGKKAPLDRITFKASENQQSVVISFDEGYPAFGRMDICVVKDKKNWTCKTGPFSQDSMIRGEYQRKPPDLDTYYVPKWKWWSLELPRRLNE